MSLHNTLFLLSLFLGLGIASSTPQVAVVYKFAVTVYKDGTFKKFDEGWPLVPATVNAANGVQSKDVVITQKTGLTARLFMPRDDPKKGKLPVLVYYHGGGFCTGNAAHSEFNEFATTVAAQANIALLSVNYRLAPEHKYPVGLSDSWNAVKWLANHATRNSPEKYLKEKVDFSRVFVGGDSSGANLAHNVAMRYGKEKLPGTKLAGLILLSPYFVPKLPTPSMMRVDEEMRNNVTKLWSFVCPATSGLDDPRVNPMMDPKLSTIGCKKVLINVAELDPLVDAGKMYTKAVQERTGKVVEIFESKGKTHDHQLRKPDAEVLDRMTRFVNS